MFALPPYAEGHDWTSKNGGFQSSLYVALGTWFLQFYNHWQMASFIGPASEVLCQLAPVGYEIGVTVGCAL